MKLEATLTVRGPVYSVPQDPQDAPRPLSPDRVYCSGDIPGAMLFIGGRYAGTVIDMRVHGDTHLTQGSTYASPEEFVVDEVELRCILEF